LIHVNRPGRRSLPSLAEVYWPPLPPRATLDGKGVNMKVTMMVALMSMAMAAAGAASGQDQSALAKSSGCLNCHAVDTKKMGPAFKDIAAKYKGKADAEATLVAEISGAKGHPTVKASPDDIKTLVKWVLAQ
jgi:cytochrome c